MRDGAFLGDCVAPEVSAAKSVMSASDFISVGINWFDK
jgi:hypothetical protein